MKKLVTLVLALALAGCCTTRNPDTGVSVDSYVAALKKVSSNVAEIRSDIATLDYDPELKKAHMQVMDATVTLCDDTLAGKNAGGDE